MKKILIINGHPDKESLCTELARYYQSGAQEAGAQCQLINLGELEFSPVLKYGYRKRTTLEPDLEMAWKGIQEADHLVFVYPTWWGTQPALLKGFIDRVFLPGFAFQYRENSLLWDKLLKGKSARLIVTMDTPGWYYRWVYQRPGHNAMRKCVLNFCGVKPVKITSFRPVKASSEQTRLKWLEKVRRLGIRMV
ncbi:NAD(P)H-dependent oxidoreductase [Carboxylicivirga sediminis]|uniref:NAD(P)H-dependent oxidoreductase n=1 Tax=Carboxylicivirga sediminis TaxID=2006564 RepID=A0A941F5P1_9BACT|nr:NAD(P)H-dependent oxidoreductase [Carboxylicivirga sediminis]MBR8537296.1 NAD(P)H-dependent oxidoreductase [Carboxylicivirga sediminis]